MLLLFALSCKPDPPASVVAVDTDTPRVYRLTHTQWEWTVQGLLGLDEWSGLSEGFVDSTLSEGFDNDVDTLKVGAMQFQDYQRAAEVLASDLVADEPRFALVASEALDGDPAAWVARFGEEAFRRPLTTAEVTEWTAFYDRGPELIGSGDPVRDGVQLVVQAMLQAPAFVYRTETGAPGEKLGGYELASKLSYSLWDRPPDQTLLDDVDRLSKPAVLKEHTARLLAHQRAEEPLMRLHGQLFRLDDYENIAKVSPDWSADYNPLMLEEAELFLTEVVFREQAGWARLMTADFTFANGELAALYGLDGGEAFEKVQLDPEQRSGMLTLSGFLTLLAEDDLSNPIQRGSFVVHEVLCVQLPAPPDETTGLGPTEDGLSNRERVERHTGDGTCGEGCHSSFINPAGFAFEHYDGLGRWQSQDLGGPINSTATMVIDGQQVTYSGATQFAEILANSPQVHGCYVESLLRHTWARELDDADAPVVERMTRASLQGASTLSLVDQAVTSEAFTCNR